LGPSF